MILLNLFLFVFFEAMAILMISQSLDEDTESMNKAKAVKEIEVTKETETETTSEAEVEPVTEMTVQETQPSRPQYYIEWLGKEISKEEFEMLCRLTFCEAGNQDLETQTMVCLTVLNRLNNPKTFADSIYGVVYQRLDGVPMYSVIEWSDFETKEWTEQVEMAVKNAMACNNHPSDMYYFRTEHYHTFGQPYMVSGALWFSTQH